MLEQSLICALGTIAIWATMWEGMIFGFVRKHGLKHWGEGLQKVVFDCPICQLPYYGTVIYAVIFHNEFLYLWEVSRFDAIVDWAATILVGMGINSIIVKFLPENW